MADEVVEWARELIPDDSRVFMRAHRQHFSQGELDHGVFRRRKEGLSVDWTDTAMQKIHALGQVPIPTIMQ